MKPLNILSVLVIIVLANSNATAQLPENDMGEIVFSDVVEITNMTKKQLHEKSKSWILSTLKSADNMVGLAGEGNDYSEIVATGNLFIDKMEYDWHQQYGKRLKRDVSNISLNFKFIVKFKEGRLKYSIENLLLSYDGPSAYTAINTNYTTGLKEVICPLHIQGKRKGIFENEFQVKIQELVGKQINNLVGDFIKSMSSTEEDW